MIMLPPFRGFVRVFAILCGAVFVLELVSRSQQDLVGLFGLTPAFVFERGMVHQLITWTLLHGSLSHLLFNMLGFWMFGSALEDLWGNKRFAKFCLTAGIFSGMIVCLFGLFDPATYMLPTIGASGIVFAVLMAVSRLFPYQTVLVFFIFPMRMKYFAYLMIGIEFYALYTSNQHGISNIAHLGGALIGFLWAGFSGPGYSTGSGFGWFRNLRDRWHQRRMRKRLRVIVPKQKEQRFH